MFIANTLQKEKPSNHLTLNKDFKVPKLRFKNFDNCWQKDKLDAISKYYKGGYLSKDDIDSDGTIPCILYGELYTRYLNKIEIIFSRIKYKTNLILAKKDDVILPLSGETPLDISNSAVIPFDGIALGGDLIALRTSLNPLFLSYQLSGKRKLQIARLAQGKSVVHLNPNLLMNLWIFYPSKNEQNKIAQTLFLISKKIELINRKVKVLKKYKEGILKTISKQGKTFVLRDIICEENVRTKTSNEYPILSSTSEGIFLQNDYFNHQVARNNNAGYKIVKKNQVVFSPQNLWLGNINLNDKFEIGAVSPSYKVYSLKRDLIDPYYFIEYMKSPYMLYQYKLCSKQGASVVRRNLDIDSFLRIKIKLPTLENQQTIKILQQHISNLKNLLQKLIKIKKYLLANMFI